MAILRDLSNRPRTSAYLFTTDSRFSDEVKAAKKVASTIGGHYIDIKGRGARVKDDKGRSYTCGGDNVGGLDNAERFDVYLRKRYGY